MNRFIRRNQKKLLAVFGAFLMVVFIVQLAPKGMQSGPVEHTAGTLAGTKISQLQIIAASDEWRLLRQLRYADPNGRDITLLDSMIGPDATAAIDKNPRAFFLLLAETRQQGIVVDNEQVQSVLHNDVANLPADGTDEMDRVVQAVHDFMAVQTLLMREASVIKISAPLRQFMLARGDQLITLNVVNFPAGQYLDKVKKPTDLDLRNQFDTFSDKIAGNYGSAADPLGFGYKTPPRVKVQFIGLHRDDVRRAAIASKDERDWYVAAFGEFKANRDEYDKETLPAATEPTSRPTTQPLAAATTQPARKLDDLDADFQLHAPLVLNHLYDQATQDLGGQILRKISDALSNGFGNWHDAQAASPTTMPAAIAQYASYAFFENLARSIQKQFGVLPVTGNIDQFKAAEDLIQVPEIGRTYFVPGANSTPIPFAFYATAYVDPLMDASMKNSQQSDLRLAVWQPSKLMIDQTGSDYYFFRISAADPAHVPPMADVKDKVLADWKLSGAYDMANDAAHALLTDARNRGLPAAAKSAGRSIVMTEPFQPTRVLDDTSSIPTIRPLNLKGTSARDLAAATQELLSASPTSGTHPLSVAELPPDAVIAVIQLDAATPLWTSENRNLAESQLIYRGSMEEKSELWAQLCDYGALAERMDFRPEASFKNP